MGQTESATEKQLPVSAGGSPLPRGSGSVLLNQGLWRVVNLLTLIGLFSTGAVAQSTGVPISYLHPRIESEEGWKANLNLANAGRNTTTVRLLAYDDGGNLLKEMSGGPPWAPGKQRAYSEEDGVFPERTTALKVKFDGLLLTSAVLESRGWEGARSHPPRHRASTGTHIPSGWGWQAVGEPPRHPQYRISGGPRVAVVVLDWEGHQLAKRFLPSLPPMASPTAGITDLFRLLPFAFSIGSITTVCCQPRSIFAEASQLQVPSEHKRLVIESEKISLELDQIRRIILRIHDLPQESRLARGLALGRDRFSQAILSPRGNLMAFAVDGFHGWSGLYDLNRNKISEVAFFFQGKATQLSFSPNGRYLAIEALGGGGFSAVLLWDVQEDKALSWQVPKSPSGLPANARIQEWVGGDLKILLRWVDEQAWQAWSLEVKESRVTPRRLK